MSTRRSREELRKLVLAAGVDVLRESAVGLSIEALTYKSAFDHLERSQGIRVTYASVHERIWPSQRDFQMAVLAAAVESLPEQTFNAFDSAAVAVLRDIPTSTPGERRYAAQELTRVAINANFETNPKGYDLAQSLRYLCATLDPADAATEPLFEVVAAMRQRSLTLYSDLVTELVGVLGLRTRPGLGMSLGEAARVLAASGNALSAGFEMDMTVAPTEPLGLTTGPDESSQEWHHVALGVWAVTRTLFELDGDIPPEDRVL